MKINLPKLPKLPLPDLSKWRLPGFSVIIGILTFVGILITHKTVQNDRLPEHPTQMVLNRDITMVSFRGIDSTIVRLHKGDTVSYLGMTDGGVRVPVSLVVQSHEGLRGLLPAVELGYPMLRKNSKDTMTVTVLGRSKEKGETYPKFKIRCGDGSETRVSLDDIRPILPDSIRQLQFRRKSYYYMSQQKFERLYLGKTLGENDSLYRPAINIGKTKNGWEAFYQHLTIVDTDEGYNYQPIIAYDSQQVAVGYRPSFAKGTGNRYIIKYMPLLRHIIDIDMLASLIQGPLYQNAFYGYDNYTAKQRSDWSKIPIWEWVKLGIYIIFGLIWIYLFGTLAMLLMESGLYCRYLYYPLSDDVVTYLFAVVAFISTYVWFGLATVWGAIWLLTPIILIAGFNSYKRSIRHLNTEPHCRCLKCRRMFTNELLRREFIREYDEWRHESIPVSSKSNSWQTYTEVTTKYSDGSTKTGRENVRNHSRTTTTYEEYDVLYHIKEFNDYYQCSRCGNIEKVFVPEETVLKSIYKGTSTSTTET